MAAMAKCFASDVAMKVATDAVQLFGAAGVSNEYPINRYFRDAKVVQIIEGTNQIQRNIIANTLLGREQKRLSRARARIQEHSAMFRNDLLQGKRILVTGGGTGLGKSIAKRYLELGADVVICGRRTEVLEATARGTARGDWRRASRPHGCDVRDADGDRAMMTEHLGEGAARRAGQQRGGQFHRAHRHALAARDRCRARTSCCTARSIAPSQRRPALDRGAAASGTVLSVATTPSFTGLAFTAPSAAAKAGIVAMTRSLAVEWGPKGIRLNAVAPGLFPTAGAWERLYPPRLAGRGPAASACRCAASASTSSWPICFAYLASDESGYITGELIVIDGGRWMQGVGGPSARAMQDWTDEQWEAMRKR